MQMLSLIITRVLDISGIVLFALIFLMYKRKWSAEKSAMMYLYAMGTTVFLIESSLMFADPIRGLAYSLGHGLGTIFILGMIFIGAFFIRRLLKNKRK